MSDLVAALRSFLADLAVIGRWLRWAYAARPGTFVFLVGWSALTAALNVAFPWGWQHAVDAVGSGAPPRTMATIGLWLAGAGLGHAFTFAVLQSVRARTNLGISRDARLAVIAALVDADADALRTWRPGDLVARVHSDAGERISWYVCAGVFRAYESLLVGLGALVAVAAIAPAQIVWLLVPVPLAIAAQIVGQRGMARTNAAVQAAVSETADAVASTFGAIRAVQAGGLEHGVRTRFAAAAAAQAAAEIEAARLQQAVGVVFQNGWVVAGAGIVASAGLGVIDGQLTLGQLITLEGLVGALIWPMMDLGALVSRAPSVAVALRRLDEVRAIRARTEEVGAPAPDLDGGLLRARDVAVEVDGVRVFSGVDLDVRRGERVAVVGRIGSGKSLLLDVACGIRAPADGEVARAGEVALVPQDPALLAATVRENVLLGRDVDEATLRTALAVAQLDADLARMPQGLDTIVGERGVTLSGGQRQRVAIARALAGRPDLLVLDDATSALDAAVEAAFWAALHESMPEIGVLFVTHRAGTLSAATRTVGL